MCAAPLPFLAGPRPDTQALPGSFLQRVWWSRFAARCSADLCPNRGKLWPSWLRMEHGLYFDGRWYCEPSCAEPVLEFRIRQLLSGFVTHKTKNHRLPLGLLLVHRGLISSDQLRQVLRSQRENPGAPRIGQLLRNTGVLSEDQLASALAQQWGYPLFPLDHQTAHPAWSSLVPLPLLDAALAVPAHASPDTRVLHLAFGERIDHPLLYAIEHMLGCRTVPCVAAESKIIQFLAYWRRRIERQDISFDSIREPREMTRVIRNYASELQAVRLSVTRASAHVWARFFGRYGSRDVLFRIVSGSAAPSTSEKFSFDPKFIPFSADTRKDGVSDVVSHP
jgi:Type II secretion system (T2SS), protein E, N-terminal domain